MLLTICLRQHERAEVRQTVKNRQLSERNEPVLALLYLCQAVHRERPTRRPLHGATERRHRLLLMPQFKKRLA